MDFLLEPFTYRYMVNAIWISALVGLVCGFLSSYLILKGWSLIGDALSHAIVPGVAGAYMLGLPFSVGAFLAGGLAAAGIMFLNQQTTLKQDAIIGIIFTSFFALGLFMISISPASIDIQKIILGNVLAISTYDSIQLGLIGGVTLVVLFFKWKDIMLVFFDEHQAKAIGIDPFWIKVLFFTLLSASTVAALQTVGAFLVIALVITPGATAYLLTDRFPRLVAISSIIGATTCFFGAYISYFLDGATGGIIVVLQTCLFLIALVFAPKHGILNQRRKAKKNSLNNADMVQS
ncbi:MAG: metal ABC transporter permease [Rhizobiaceae bacterium]|nr:metal ABC transporter permease [Rhizobiaceae bacterium]